MRMTFEDGNTVSIYNEFGKMGTENYEANVRAEIDTKKYGVTLIALTCLAFIVIIGFMIAQAYHPELSFFPGEIARNHALASIILVISGVALAALAVRNTVHTIQKLRNQIAESERMRNV